jgi:hypothetical protein
LKRRTVLAAFAALAATLPVVSSCGDDSPTGPGAGVSGAYTLRTVNGSNLPFVVIEIGADKIEVLNETLTLSGNGSFTQAGMFRLTESGVVTTEPYAGAGTWSVTGTSITLVYSGGGDLETGTVGTGSITFTDDFFTRVYRK